MLVCGALSAAGADAPKETPKITAVQIEPAEVVLSDADQSAQFLVTLKMSDGTLRDATRTAEYSFQSADGRTDVATIESGRLKPKGDGSVVVTVAVVDPETQQKLSASAKTTVSNFAVERELHFVNDIEPVLTKTGCNAGGCHGKASGQNGFKLSLFAFEPKFDYDALVNEAHGRRVFSRIS